LASLSGDFKPGVSRDEAILGKSSDTTVTPENQGTQPPKEEPPKPGSLLEQIQNDVDKVETVPVPSQEPLDTNPR
jgi:outer membrane protein assembly factor BamE